MFCPFVLFYFFALNTLAEPIQATDENVSFLYESGAEILTSREKLASILSSDCRKARDEFSKHDLLEEIKPVINIPLEKSKNTRQIIIKLGGRLGDYDFSKKAFPTGVSEKTFIPYQNGYAITFTNSEDFS